MRKVRTWMMRLAGLFNKQRKDRELDEELQSHLQMHIDDNLRSGMTAEEARRRAMIQLGGVESTKEAYRDQRGLPLLETLWQDVRYGARILSKHPGFTIVVVLTLALGIGANTALFTAMDTVMFRPLQVREPDRLVLMAKENESFSFPFYERLRDALTSVEGLAASQFRGPRRSFVRSGAGDEAQEITTHGVTGNFFNVLGVPPLIGRTFNEDDDRKGAPQPVVVLSHAFWAQRLGGDSNIIGASVRLDNVPVTVIGVMPPEFVGFVADAKPDLWWPLQLVSQLEPGRSPMGEGVSWLVLFGRLREGVTREQAQAEASVFFRNQLEQQVAKNPNRPQPERDRILNQKLDLLPGRAGFVGARGEFRQPLIVLMAAVAVVLLIACTNIAGLLLARGVVRQREFAVRAALGAGRRRMARQLVIESLMLALIGGTAGLLVARAGTTFLSNFIAQSSTPVALAPDSRALFFSFAVSILTGLIFGAVPAWRSSRVDLATAIKNQGNATMGASRGWLQPTLVTTQVALSVLLLAGAGLFVRTLRNLRTVNFGFQGSQLVCLSIDPGRSQRDRIQQELLVRRVLSELESLPGIRSVSFGGGGLLTGNGISMDVAVEGYSPAPNEEMGARTTLAGPRFFETMGVPLLRGREFTTADEPPPPPAGKSPHATVAIIGEAMARRFFGESDPVGKRFTVDGAEKVTLEIIGVAKDTRYSKNLRTEIPLQFYIPFFGSGIQMPPTFYLRTDQPATVLVPVIGKMLAGIGPEIKIRNLQPMNEVIDSLLLRERIIAQLVSIFSGFALLLACLGVYGILSFRVVQRTREIGVRMALGATLQSVIRLVLGQGLKLVVIGCAVGLVVALIATRSVAALLYGVTPADPLTFAAVFGVLASAAALASWLPARRAAKVQPMVALRHE